MRRFVMVTAVFGALFALAISSASAGVSGPAFYVDGVVYRTVGTPTNLPVNDGNEHSFDIIYQLHGVQDLNVAEAAPGDRDYNGGRWMVYSITFDDYDAALAAHDANGSGDFDSDAEILAAIAAGDATNNGVVANFECPVIKMPQGGR